MHRITEAKTKRIAFLLLSALVLPIAGCYIAADIEDSQASPGGGLLAWTLLTAL